MSSALDMSLDDIIKNNKNSGSARPGPTRRVQNRPDNRSTPYTTSAKAPELAWKHDKFVDQAYGGPPQGSRAIETGTKLYISNLEYGVSNEDIKELFSEVGDLKRCTIHYDRSGRSKGTAEVVFSRQTDAAAAVKRYNNVQLDGKPMKIETVGTNIVLPAVRTPAVTGAFGSSHGNPRSERGGALGRNRGGGGGGGRGSGRGRGRGRGREEKISPEDLDADLEKYHSESMQTN